MLLVKQKVKPNQFSLGKLYIMYVYRVSKHFIKHEHLDLDKIWNLVV